MKKLLMLCLALMLVLAVPALAESPFVGTWTEPVGSLTINADGTAVMNFTDGSVSNYTWEETAEGGQFTGGMWSGTSFVLDDENTLNIGYGWFVMTREGAAAAPAGPAATPVGAEGAAFIGEWNAVGAEMDGIEMGLDLLGLSMTLTLNEDGTAHIASDGEEENSTWFVQDGIPMVYADPETAMPFTPTDDGRLSLDMGGIYLYFASANAAPAAAPAADPNAAPAFEYTGTVVDYYGTWKLDTATAEGVTLPASALGMDMILVINEDGTAQMILGEAGNEEEAENSTWTYEDGIFTLEGGNLVIDPETLQMSLLADDVGMNFVKVVEEAEAPAADPAPAAAPADATAYYGFWTLSHAISEGIELPADMLGMSMTIDVKEDGSADLVDGENSVTTTWSIEGGAFTIMGMPFSINENGQLVMDQQGTLLCFVKGEAPAAAPADPFVGVKFVCTGSVYSGVVMSAADIGAADDYVIFNADNTATMVMGGIEMPTLTWARGPVTIAGTDYADGFSIDFYGTPYIFGVDGERLMMDYFGLVRMYDPAE